MIAAALEVVAKLDALRLNQTQKEAVLDGLLYAMEADGILSQDEVRFLDQVAGSCTWQGKTDLARHLVARRQEIRAILADGERRTSFVIGLKNRIGHPQAARALYLLCDRMANADGRVVNSEIDALQLLVAAMR